MTKNEFVGARVSEIVAEGEKDFGLAIAAAEREWLVNPNRVTRGGNAKGTKKELFELAEAGPISEERFKIWLADGSDNIRRNEKFYRAIMDLGNAIWAKTKAEVKTPAKTPAKKAA